MSASAALAVVGARAVAVRWLLQLLSCLALVLPALSFAQTYSVSNEPYSWVSTAGHTNAAWNFASCAGGGASVDDDITQELPLGFTFRYGSTNYTTVRVMSNGRLQFNNTYCYPGTAGSGPPPTYTLPFPDANLTQVMRIYGADLDPSAGGTVTYASQGTAPNRSFVVTWTNVQEWGQGSSRFNLQVVLYENGDFVYQFGSISNPSGGKAQIGWELTTGDYGLYSFSSIGAIANTAIRWSSYKGGISGTVFEDLNYGGGAGRNLSSAGAAGGSGRSGARVELYRVSGSNSNYVNTTTTDASGGYSFTALSGGTYQVRVVNSTVTSGRTGYVSTLLPVQTYRTDGSSIAGTVNAVTDRVGGESPNLADAAANSSATLESLTTASVTAQSVAPIQVAANAVSGVDFGFNFSTVVNTNNSGQGSLRQAIANANLLGGDAALAQSGRTAGIENLVFMIGNGSAAAGLRSANNYFSGGVATITPASALPTIGSALVIDAQTQPGWTQAPVVQLSGGNAGASVSGLSIASSTASTVRGLVIGSFTANGITVTAGSGHVIAGNYIGLNAAGTAAAANGKDGINVTGATGLQIGGASTSQRNVVSGNGSNGVALDGAGVSGVAMQGNYIGTDAAGATAVPNASFGVYLKNGSTGNTVGGSVSGAGNVISGNGSNGIRVEGPSNTIQGNTIGLNAAASAALPNSIGVVVNGVSGAVVGGTSALAANILSGNSNDGLSLTGSGATGATVQGNFIGTNAALATGLGNGRNGIYVQSGAGSNTLGGTASGAPNTIAGNVRGVVVAGAGTGNVLSANSIYGNTTLGIDLGADGISANDGLKSTGQPNLLMDYPVITSASFSGSTLTVAGYVGSAAGQSTFGSSRVEIFVSDASVANGQGKTYLGALTADASGNFSGSIANVVGLGSSSITATATDSAGNTSEFGPNYTPGLVISGTVFEDVNYGGGNGRSLGTASGSGVGGATVELYSASGSFVASTTTASGGSYSFSGLAASTAYFVRVVNTSVLSTRSGTSASLVPVMTYRTEAASGTPVAVTNEVGGIRPAAVDAAAGSGGTTLWTSCATENGTCSFSGTRTVRYGATSGSASGWVTRVISGGTACTNTVFGDPISGTVKACYLLNADYQSVATAFVASGNLAGLDFGFNFDTVVNTNDSGAGSLRQAITNANTLGGDASLAQSGRTAGVENIVFMISNGSAAAGLRSSINYFSSGVATIAPASALPDLSTALVLDAQTQPGWSAAPVVELNGSGAGAGVSGLTARGNVTIRGFAINRYTLNGVNLLDASGNVLQGCYIGTNAAGGAASANTGVGVNVYNAPGVQIGGTGTSQGNVVSGNGGIGINLVGSSAGAVVQGNTMGLNAAGTARVANGSIGLLVAGGAATIGGTSTAARNVISGNTYENIQVASASATVQGNYIGTTGSGSTGITNGSDGVYVNAAGSVSIGGTAAGAGNVIAGNAGRGVTISGAVTGVAVLGNSIFGNANIGIDLANDGLTANDGVKTVGQPNLKMDYPVFTSATYSGSTLTVAGYVGSAAGQSTFASARVEVFVSDGTNTNGQGKTYAGFVTADASGNFSGTVTVASGITPGTTKITGTATDGSNNSSEFGPNAAVGFLIGGTVFEDLNYGGGAGRNKTTALAAGASVRSGARVELAQIAGSTATVVAVATTDAAGNYSFTGLAAGSYAVRVMSASVTSSRSGYVSSLIAVPTYHANSSGGAAVDVTDEVGGRAPAFTAYSSTPASVGTSSSTAVDYADAIGLVTLTTAGVAGIDFGYSFDVVTNTNDSGQGSLRQAITNANTLGGDASLAQGGRTAAVENLVFMISNGSAGGGLRSANNFFSGGVATIAPASALPALTAALVIDAQTQPGWTANPVVDINGSGAGAVDGFVLGGGSTLRGLVIRRFASGAHGAVYVSGGNGNTVQGCWIGLNAAGTVAAGNAYGVYVASGGNTIGGSSPSQRNVISGNSGSGVVIWSGADSNAVKGNYIGLNAAGTSAVGNAQDGIVIFGTNTTVGGVIAGEGNVIAGNNTAASSSYGGLETAGTGTAVIRGNLFGLKADGSAAITSNGTAIIIGSPNNTVGGTAAGAGNTITGHTLRGVSVNGSSTVGVTIQGNSIYANGSIGIDLGSNGVTANDGVKTSSQPNLLMDYPVITAAGISGTNLTVSGYVGSAAGQSTFAGARVEVFVSDATNTNGQGQTYLGYLTSDASGNFSGTIAGVGGVTLGTTKFTATATDGSGNTSEFGPNFTLGGVITGTVFEDLNYGGGAGRSLAVSSANGGAGVAGATVELYNSSGVFVTSTSTASGGGYSLQGLASGNYYVRVVSASVLSTRSGSSASAVGVLTWRTDASSGTAAAVTNVVGGTDPAKADPGVAGSGAAFSTSTFVFSAGLSGTAQNVAPVSMAGTGVGGVDFGFNFDTVVNTNDSGQGSLRQAIINANTLGNDGNLAQSGRTAAVENLVFMIGNGTAGNGLRSAYNYFTTPAGSYNVATITPASALPTISSALVLDAQTQPGWTANPVVELNGTSAGNNHGLTFSATGSTVRGFVVNRFQLSGITLNGGSNTVQGCWLGLNAAGSAAAGNGYAGVNILSGANTIGGNTATTRNVVSGNGTGQGTLNAGVLVQSGSANKIVGNYVGLDPAGTTAIANKPYGLDITGTGTVIGGTATGAGNVIAGNTLDGIILRPGADGATLQGNTVGGNAGNTAAVANGRLGIDLQANTATVGGTAANAANTVRGNATGGVAVVGNATGNAISANRIYGNGGIGIDLGYTQAIRVNTGSKTVGAPNQYMNYPVFTSASLSGTTLTVAGYVGSAAGQTPFGGATVEVFVSDASNANGQGQSYLGALTADANGNFSGTLGNVAGVTSGSTKLTGTATDSGSNTSEFGPNLLVGQTLAGKVFEDVNYGGGAGRNFTTSGGTGLAGAVVELYDGSGAYVSSTTTAAGGSYSFVGVGNGNYYVRVASTTVASQRSGSIGTLRGVMTYRTNATSGTAVDVTDWVGGTNPAAADPGAASSGAVLNTSSYVFSAGPSGTAHAVAPVTTSNGSIANLDFGFNFDTVTNTNASGPGSLAQAITNAGTLGNDGNLAQSGRTAGVENLVFMISNGSTGAGGSLGLASGGLRSTLNYFSGGVATITPAAALPAIGSALVLDAQTQPGWTTTPVVELNGTGAGNNNGLVLGAAGSIARGFIVNRWAYAGIRVTASATVQGNWLGTTSTGLAASPNGQQGLELNGGAATVGGTGASQGNVISGNTGAGIWISGGGGHVIQGNLIGVGYDGSTRVGNATYFGIEAYGSGGNTIGGSATGAGNTLSGQTNTGKGGIYLCSNNNSVLGNRIGTTASGLAAVPNAGAGIGVCASVTGNSIGGTAAGTGNLISGNGGHGIDASSPVTVQGNTIGMKADGSAALANAGSGISLSGGTAGSVIGGTASGAANWVAGNTGKGVAVRSGESGVPIQRNRIHGNGGIGIDLGNDGVSVNDGLKTAGAANLLMDYPVFTGARATGSQLSVAGYVGSAANQSTFAFATLDIYLSDKDSSGYGGGKTWLGTLTADGSGNFSGTVTMPVASLPAGSQLTATATDGSGNTSEFGVNFAGLVVDLVVNSNLDEADSNPGDGSCLTASGVCTLRAAIAELNASAAQGGTPSITFAIPGCSSYGSAGCRITPATALPSVTRTVLIDGSTQAGFSTSSYAPIIEISGSAAPANTTGLVVAANNATVRGLAINRFAANGITLSGSGGALLGLCLGLNAGSATSAANGGAGAYITGNGATIGTAAAADANTIAGNTGSGIVVAASGAVIGGNFIGTDSAGTGGLGNGGSGVFTMAGGFSGISVAANTVANNAGNGVAVAGGAAQVQILGNSIYGNGGLGIDLGNDGVTANTGATDSARPNNGINHPVVTGAGIASASMTVYGYVGTGAGQAAFANVRVEFFKAAADPSGYGEGRTYLGTLTTDASGRFSGSVALAGGAIAVGDLVTATATDSAGNTSEFGPNWTSTSLAALTPGSFNAFDTDAAANALSGVIRSRVAGTPTPIAVIALDNTGSALHPGFTGNVTLTWVDARNDTGTSSGSCRSSWVDAGTAGTAAFSNNNRLTVSVTPPASGTRVMRLKMSYVPSGGGSTVVACSNDAFAALPASYSWLGASDTDSASAGTARVLSTTSASGGNVHRAGRPFTVRAQALDATGALMTGYDGTPTLATAGCLLPAGCSAAALTAASTAAVAGSYTHSAVSYAEVGAIQLQLTDSSYADIDAADTAAGVRTLTSSLLAVGRFVPDSLTASIATSGQFATANGACMASGSGATFIGQGFGWATAPQLTITARNAAGNTTTYWTGSLMKLTAAMVSEALGASGTGSATLGSSFGAVAVADLGGGQARLTASATDRFLLDLAAGSVQDSITPSWTWTATVADNSEAAVSGNPTLATSANQAGVGFNSGGVFHSGRLSLSPGYGDTRAGVRLLAQLQRYTAAGWVTMTEDQGCITINNNNVGVESPVGVFTTAGVCAAPMQAAVTTRGGRAWISLPATPGGAPGRLTLRLAGGGASGNSCTAAGASAALVGMGLPWLMGGSSAAGPQAFATWGATQRDAVLRRETW